MRRAIQSCCEDVLHRQAYYSGPVFADVSGEDVQAFRSACLPCSVLAPLAGNQHTRYPISSDAIAGEEGLARLRLYASWSIPGSSLSWSLHDQAIAHPAWADLSDDRHSNTVSGGDLACFHTLSDFWLLLATLLTATPCIWSFARHSRWAMPGQKAASNATASFWVSVTLACVGAL